MDDFTRKDMEEALRAMALMIDRTEKAKEKFVQGTSQYTLQKNRLEALNIASLLILKELADSNVMNHYTKGDIEKALAPISSLISKSEKAQKKLAKGTWQHTMLSNNLKALYIALPLLTKELSGMSDEKDEKQNINIDIAD